MFCSDQLSKYIVKMPKALESSSEKSVAHYAANSVLFYKDHAPYGVFVIHEGQLKFSDHLYQDLFELHPPYPVVIGLDMALSGQLNPTTVCTLDDAKVSFIPLSKLKEIYSK